MRQMAPCTGSCGCCGRCRGMGFVVCMLVALCCLQPTAEALPVTAAGIIVDRTLGGRWPTGGNASKAMPDRPKAVAQVPPAPQEAAGPDDRLPVFLRNVISANAARNWLPEGSSSLWARLLAARKGGPHHAAATAWQQQEVQEQQHKEQQKGTGFHRLAGAQGSANVADWYYLLAVLGLFLAMDVTVLQNLPDTTHTNLVLLVFWYLVGITLAAEVWLRRGPRDGMDWITGYLTEVIFSVDQVFVLNLIFWALATPQRLLAKAMFITLIGNLACRGFMLLGLAPALERLRVVPYGLGLWLLYCGVRQVAGREGEGDVTQNSVVRTFRGILGSHFGEYYDEEDEAIFAAHKNRYCVTLLGVALLCSSAAGLVLSLDVAMLKRELLPDMFLDFSSAAVAAFATRALFFVVRDQIAGLEKYSLGMVLLFLGAEALVGRTIYVSAILSSFMVAFIVVVSAAFAWLRAGYTKPLR